MSKKDLDEILRNLGKEVEEEQYNQSIINHEFSEDYKVKRQSVLNSLDTKNQKKIRKPFVAAAAAALIFCASLTVYAASKMFSVTTTPSEAEDGINIEVSKHTQDYIPPIEITPEYLPEGYAAFEEGKYSLNGEWAGDGLTIVDAGYYKSYFVPDVSDYEELQIGDAKAVLLYRNSYGYPWQIYLFYEETGHVIQVFGSDAFSKDEIVKVCENLSYKEVPEKDPDHTYSAFAYEAVEEEEIIVGSMIEENNRIGIGDMAPCFGMIDDNILLSEEVEYSVKSINITDQVQTELVNSDTVYDYEQVLEYIQQDGTLKPYTRTVNEWNDGTLEEKAVGTVGVKNVEVTVEVKNGTDRDLEDVNMQPVWKVLSKNDQGKYDVVDEYDALEDYIPEENFRGGSPYGINLDGMAYYFDASAFIGNPHFYNMALAAGETKEVHLWFAIPEDMIDTVYLVFSMDCEGYTRFIKVQ